MNLWSFLVCPDCKGCLTPQKSALFCQKCRVGYPIKYGIYDFRNYFSDQDTLSVNYFSRHLVMINAEYLLEEWHRSFLGRFEDAFPQVKNRVILDGGVGQGYMTVELAGKGAFLIACDIVFEALMRLKKIAEQKGLGEKILFVCCSVENLPIRDQCVDFFIMNAVLEHLAKEEEAVSEVARVCQKHAGLMVTAPLRYRFLNPLFIPSSIWQDKMIGHLRRYDEKSLSSKFGKYLFNPKKIYYSGHFKKVIFTKFFLPLLNSEKLIKLFETADRKEGKTKYGASNICVLFQR